MEPHYRDYQADAYRLDSAACRYPNFAEILKYYPISVVSFAGFADVTQELLLEAIKGTEELTAVEGLKCARYSGIPFSVLICPKLIELDRNNWRHREMMRQLNGKLYEILEWQKKGSKYADMFMRYCGRVWYVNMDLQFRDGRPVTYGRYLGIKERMDQAISFAQGEFTPATRGLSGRRAV